MSTSPNENILTWSLENYATAISIGSSLAICSLVFYIYTRAGSLLFLRDLMWRFFGGTTAFENSDFEKMRKDLRELEYFRFEFNIPARTLEHAKHAQNWISQNSISVRDIAWVKPYIDWGNFENIKFKEKIFAPWLAPSKVTAISAFLLLGLTAAILSSKDYLMVHLKNEPDAPSFYLSEDNVKFQIFADEYLTTTDCSSPERLNKITPSGLTPENLDTICSILIDSQYINHVHRGLKEQKYFLFMISFWSLAIIFYATMSLGKQFDARTLSRKLSSQASPLSPLPLAP